MIKTLLTAMIVLSASFSFSEETPVTDAETQQETQVAEASTQTATEATEQKVAK